MSFLRGRRARSISHAPSLAASTPIRTNTTISSSSNNNNNTINININIKATWMMVSIILSVGEDPYLAPPVLASVSPLPSRASYRRWRTRCWEEAGLPPESTSASLTMTIPTRMMQPTEKIW